ncbi:MAG: hypothetical protein AAB802_05095 [Patescibacteria group bacterium]
MLESLHQEFSQEEARIDQEAARKQIHLQEKFGSMLQDWMEQNLNS